MRQADSAEWAIAEIKAIEKYMGWDYVVAVEIGNECDVFSGNGEWITKQPKKL